MTNYAIYITPELLALRLKPLELLVLAQVQQLAKQRGYCWASNAELADGINTSTDSVKRAIAALDKAGHLAIDSPNNHNRRLRLPGQIAPPPGQNAPAETEACQGKMHRQPGQIAPPPGQNAPAAGANCTGTTETIERTTERTTETGAKASVECETNSGEKQQPEQATIPDEGQAQKPAKKGAAPADGNAPPKAWRGQEQPAPEWVAYFEQVARRQGLSVRYAAHHAREAWDYWQSMGWKRRSGAVKDWRATARTWIDRAAKDWHKGVPTPTRQQQPTSPQPERKRTQAEEEELTRRHREKMKALWAKKGEEYTPQRFASAEEMLNHLQQQMTVSSLDDVLND